MNTITLVLMLLVGAFCYVRCLTDEELENVKKMVDAELKKRQMDVIFASPNKLVAKPTQTTVEPDHNIGNEIDTCLDMYGTKKCRVLIDEWKMDCDKDRMHEMCEKSCRYCGNPTNPLVNCKGSLFGCCDDGLTAKIDPYGYSCPVCEDNIPELCKLHPADCNMVGMVGEWMTTNCKKTCETCMTIKAHAVTKVSECKDDPEQEAFCPSWKKEGLCKQIPDMMNAHCAKTCGTCRKI